MTSRTNHFFNRWRVFAEFLGMFWLALMSSMSLPAAEDVTTDARIQIKSLDHQARITWSDAQTNGLSVIEYAPVITDGSWVPLLYDIPSLSPRTRQLPPFTGPIGFYRIRQDLTPPDPTLVMHLAFENDISTGQIIDLSGYGNHAVRYGRPCCPTNWPSLTIGPDGSLAGEFHWYRDDYGRYGRSGDYAGIPVSASLKDLSQATIAVWVHYYASVDNDYNNDHNSTILNSGNVTPGVFFFGRNFSYLTRFEVFTNASNVATAVVFPDDSRRTGDSGGWNHYAITFDQGLFTGYYNGIPISTNRLSVSALTSAGYYLGIGVWTFNRTPEIDLDVDLHPNNGWINGRLDDLRVYRRALSSRDIHTLYHSFDTASPTIPQNPSARAASSNVVELRWSDASDPFTVAGYHVYRDGSLIGVSTGSMFLDTNAIPGFTHRYHVDAFDPSGFRSEPSAELAFSTEPSTASLEFIVDDDDGLPWVEYVGSWSKDCCWINGAWGVGWRNDGNAGKGLKSATFRPLLTEAGTYEVFVRFVSRQSFTGTAPFVVNHLDGVTPFTISQINGGGTWKSLGQFRFAAGTDGSVVLGNTGTTGLVIADAVRWVRR